MGIVPLSIPIMVPEHILIQKIDAFLAATRMTPSQFGIKAANDAKLVPSLRNGRELRGKTRRRIEAYMTSVATSLSAIVANDTPHGRANKSHVRAS